MTPAAIELRAALVEAYGPHIDRRLETLDVDRGLVEDAVRDGRRWLEAELTELLGRPFDRQRRGPLEVFQEAMKFPTDALAAQKIPPTTRDEPTQRILPGDHYDLAPASSNVLGEDVWRAHLAWGAEKARAMTGGAG